MARISQGILGPYSGKCGAVVGSSWKGIAVQKGYQPKVSNPRSASQIGNRDKMAYVVTFARVLLASVIKPLWDRFASQMSGYNAFVSANKDLFETALPSDFSKLVTSSGKMDATPIVTITYSDVTRTLMVAWSNDAGQGFKLAGDKAFVVAACAPSGVIAGFNTGVNRSAGAVEIELPEGVDLSDTVHVYLSFLRSDGTVVSNNSYKSKSLI